MVRPGSPSANTEAGPPFTASTLEMVSSARNRAVWSMKDGLCWPKTGMPSIWMVTNGASPVLGMPRTNTFEVPTPPELSTHTPGTALRISPVDLMFSCCSALGEMVVME